MPKNKVYVFIYNLLPRISNIEKLLHKKKFICNKTINYDSKFIEGKIYEVDNYTLFNIEMVLSFPFCNFKRSFKIDDYNCIIYIDKNYLIYNKF